MRCEGSEIRFFAQKVTSPMTDRLQSSYGNDPPNEGAVRPGQQTPPQFFLANITGCQSSLFAYICTLLGNTDHARDVLQETNLALWQKADDYDPAQPFRPWAFSFAYNQALAFRRRQQRDRLIFDDGVLSIVSNAAVDSLARIDGRVEALDYCIERLPKRQRELLHERYVEGHRINDIAARRKCSTSSLQVMLFRIRKSLLDCIVRRLSTEGRQ